MNGVDWTGCMTMLSSEKTLPYWYKMRILLDRKQYSNAVRFARGFLEILFKSRVSKIELPSPLLESWKAYRQIGGVLSDKILEDHSFVEISDEIVQDVVHSLERLLDFDDGMNFYDWGRKFFRNSEDHILELAERLYFLLNYNSHNDEYLNIHREPMPNAIAEEARKFCNNVIRRKRALKRHFEIANEVHIMSLPNEWEMVLQDQFYEGARSYFGWIHYAQFSMSYTRFYDSWQQLKHRIDEPSKLALINWLEENENNFPERFFRYELTDLDRLLTL